VNSFDDGQIPFLFRFEVGKGSFSLCCVPRASHTVHGLLKWETRQPPSSLSIEFSHTRISIAFRPRNRRILCAGVVFGRILTVGVRKSSSCDRAHLPFGGKPIGKPLRYRRLQYQG